MVVLDITLMMFKGILGFLFPDTSVHGEYYRGEELAEGLDIYISFKGPSLICIYEGVLS